jgi:hypothetical protein
MQALEPTAVVKFKPERKPKILVFYCLQVGPALCTYLDSQAVF